MDLNSLRFLSLVGCLSVAGVGGGAAGTAGDVRVLKSGDVVYVRSAFSADKDAVIAIGRGGNNKQINFTQTTLLPKTAPMTLQTCQSGEVIHSCGDDATPWNLNGTYIGANHGCSDTREVTAPKHGLTTADIGGEWTDANGAKFYVLKIFGPDKFLVLSENHGKDGVWRFNTQIAGGKLTNKASGRELKFAGCQMTQLWPSCRINKQEYLVNGETPLPDGVVTACDHLDIVEDYDIVAPDAVLDAARRNPGKEQDFVAPGLDAVLNNKIVYRFLPDAVCSVRHDSTASRGFNLGYMGFIQSGQLNRGKYDTHEYYIPKTLPFEKDGAKYDFQAIQDYSRPLPSPLYLSAADKNVADPADPPDRFLQFLGKKEGGQVKRQVGYVVGYSLTDGLTRPERRAKNVNRFLFLYTSNKTYPAAVDGKMGPAIPAGTQFHCSAYRQYFDAAAGGAATALYWRRDGGAHVVTADYHHSVDKDVLKLPAEMVGKAVTVIEKSPSVTLLTGGAVPPGGVALSVKGGYGHIVLKVGE